MKKIAIIYCSYDGILNSYCGIGTVTQAFINSFTSVKNFFLQKQISLHLHLITPALVQESLGYDRSIENFSTRMANESGGGLHLIINGSDGLIPYGNHKNWQVVSHTCATKSLEIATNYDSTIVYCVDTPFMHTARLAGQQKKAFGVDNLKFIISLHSDALIHEPNDPSVERLSWEASAIKTAILNPNIFFASTSEFLKSHLAKEYGVTDDKFVPLQTGIYPPSPRYEAVTKEKIIRGLKTYNIPLNKNLIFSVGRAVQYKGFDLLIKAVASLKNNPHLVFIASPYKTEDSNVAELKLLLKKTKISSTPIFKLDFELPKLICQWENTKVVAQLSSCEPFGLIPEEVRLWTKNNGPVILASERDGYIEQITDGRDGFLINIDSFNKIGQKIDTILNLSTEKLAKVRKAGYKRALQQYDYRVSVFKSLNQLLNNNQFSLKEFKGTL